MRDTVVFPMVMGLLASLAWAKAATQSAQDAWPLYSQAIEHVSQGNRQNIVSPAASDFSYEDYPPYPAQWHKMEAASFSYNAPARERVHEARSLDRANWPVLRSPDGKIDLRYLNGCRNLANHIADAALYEHLQGDDAGAVERLRDLLHMAELLDVPAPSYVVQSLVAVGIKMLVMNRLEVITAGIALTSDPADSKKLQVAAAKELIRQLFDDKDPAPRYADMLRREAADGQLTTSQHDRFLVQMRRGQMELNLAAMSLACHLYRFDKGRWPASIQELATYLPAPPRDAWGPIGYALIKGGRPDGADRPLVYSHCNSRDGLFYNTAEPQYSWDPGLGSGDHRKQGGQFRDVSAWAPAKPDPAPTTQPLD